jgi:hypothetical protein
VSSNDKEVDHASVVGSGGSAGIVASILVAITAVSLVLWLAYAYKFPHSRSGQLLIRVSIPISEDSINVKPWSMNTEMET